MTDLLPTDPGTRRVLAIVGIVAVVLLILYFLGIIPLAM